MTITHQGSTGTPAASNQGSTSISVAYPSGVAAGRIAILMAGVKLSGSTWGTVTDFTFIGEQAGGTGASANDAGTTRVGVWYKILTGGETGSVTVTNAGGVSSAGAMSIYSGTLGGWAAPAFVAGADTTHAANWAAICGAWAASLAAGDMVIVANSTDTDAAQTVTVPAITQIGATFGAVTQRNRSLSTTGTDSGAYSWDSTVSTGSANAPTWVHTSVTSACGATLVVRLRESVAIDLTPTILDFDAQALDPDPGAVSVSLAPTILDFDAQPLDPDPGIVSLSLTPTILHFDAQPLDALAPATADLVPTILNFGGVALDPAPGVVTADLVPTILDFDAQPLDPDPGAVSTDLAPTVLHFDAQPLGANPGAVALDLAPTILDFDAQPLSPVGAGAGSVELEPTILHFEPVALSGSPGAVSVDLAPTNLIFDPVILSPQTSGGDDLMVTINLMAPGFASIVTGIGACVVDALGQTPAGAPSRQCLLLPTQQIPWDNCDCDGQVALAIRQVYNSDVFPQPLTGKTWGRCSPHFWVARVVVSVTRCVPTMNEQGVPPPCPSELVAAITLENDRTAVRQALACCLQELFDERPPRIAVWLVEPSTTVGELGGCAGVETEFLVGVNTCPCPGGP